MECNHQENNNNNNSNNNAHPSLPIHIEEIEAREYGNPLIARGAFGEVKIAIQLPFKRRRQKSLKSGSVSSQQQHQPIHNTRDVNYIKDREEGDTILHTPKPRFLALKTIRNAVVQNHEKSSYEFTTAVFTELASLRALTPHKNVVPLLCTKYQSSSTSSSNDFLSSMNSTALSFVFPYCPSDLQEIISQRRKRNDHFTTPMIWHILKDVCEGLEYCHYRGIIHCDIKPGNIVLSTKGIFQLADFGISRLDMKKVNEIKKKTNDASDDDDDECTSKRQRRSQLDHHGLCTLYYRPPELLYGSTTYESSLDMWGVGLILAELCTLRPMFSGRSVIDQLSRIMDVLGTPTKESWPTVNDLPDYNKIKFDTREGLGLISTIPRIGTDVCMKSFIEQLILMNPEKRLSASECLNHAWLSPRSKIGQSQFNDDDEVMGQYMLQNCIYNEEVLGDDGMLYGCTMSRFDDIYEDIALDDEELLEQMKLKGVAMAEARRNLSSFD